MPSCPHCKAQLTEKQAKSIWSEYSRSKRATLGGGKAPSCICGKCRKCKMRQYKANQRARNEKAKREARQ
jgi:hypothetical protein